MPQPERGSTPTLRRIGRSISPGTSLRGISNQAMMPSTDDRYFLQTVNHISSSIPAPGFGYCGPNGQTPSLNRTHLAFAKAVHRVLPALGELHTQSGGAAVDPNCEFWLNGRSRYLNLLSRYIEILGDESTSDDMRFDLLTDLGCYLTTGFVTAREEEQLLSYWRPGGSVYALGSNEQGTERRFFHYGPILKMKTELSSKSTLGVIAGRMGSLPAVTVSMGLQERIRSQLGAVSSGATEESLRLDQLYVNHYSAKFCSGIGFHHDNPKTMMGIIAGLSLGSACELHLIAPDKELGRIPIVLSLPPRSLFCMSGLSRYHLQHGIPGIAADRLSLTFRTVNLLCAARSSWQREWDDISPEEASNAHWPLLPPSGNANNDV